MVKGKQLGHALSVVWRAGLLRLLLARERTLAFKKSKTRFENPRYHLHNPK